jgi:single-stranded DNA-binding protein
MLKETKIGEVVIVAQTTYYVYETQEKREKDEFYLCTSNEKQIRNLKKNLKKAIIINKQ